ncbi:VOC family protein [Staphylococcus haemolyticus]|uniref:VOC family protein n=1 Tax=Staphylococcus haemolyticus TaxID=1283 RepID=UPI00069D4058|nr:VOC family protein [Staphylococcus haemolyticus]MCE5022689.1 VOC family protein [Staphylococcus haemolyticus]PTK50324.1 glyoxalase/bleomycin resistance/extradiol dioxygenase family protein [Staphylococcus haemolyticus]PTK69030.1 glyoxalase/bleomycin resistance/extradiol dioxygenase family protein [Staphylococcus haemolyticus]PTK74780.1 glyoxalase/bleomycin resistance/extradiol dioxygenase family protein [Staphylococcus haemolyticus]PTL04192.1 glyoxalase/bleomycin resistance/extradiol dioxyg
MNIIANSIFVDNQEEALQFYTDILGFEKKVDEPVGEGFRWLTLVSPNQPDGAQLVLEPNGNPIAGDYQQRLFEANIPITMFGVENVQQTYDALTQKGVHFTVEPTIMGSAKMAIFNDTCGNLIQIVEQ